MAVSTNATLLANLVDPEVIGAMIQNKLTDAIKFAPLAKVDTTLVGQPGSTIKLPYYRYIGKAAITAEGQAITINQLTATTKQAQVVKYGNGVEITDEAVLSGFGDPIGESANQLILSIADAIDDDIVTELANATAAAVTSTGTVTSDDIANALVKFGEDIDGEKVVIVSADDYANLRKDPTWVAGSDVGANTIIRGTVGMIHGCQVVVSNRATKGTAYIVKPGALAIFLKRDAIVESDRDIINKSTVITADQHCVVSLVDATKAIVLS